MVEVSDVRPTVDQAARPTFGGRRPVTRPPSGPSSGVVLGVPWSPFPRVRSGSDRGRDPTSLTPADARVSVTAHGSLRARHSYVVWTAWDRVRGVYPACRGTG